MAKVVLITGISSGFGKAIAATLSDSGYHVYGLGRRISDDLISGIKVLKADVTDIISVKRVVATVLEREGRIDILINNAGMGISGSIEESPPEDFQLQMNTNFNGYVNMIQAVLPAMRAQGNATIVNISSIGGIMGLPYQGFYSASKYAIEGMSEALRMEVKPFNINIVVIRPGDFFTNFTSNRKPVKTSGAGDAYEKQFTRTMAIIENDEKKGLPPEFLARKLAKILEKEKPCQQYVIATLEQKFAVFLKKILPGSLFSVILSSHYGIKS